MSEHSYLLPDLEQQSLFHSINMDFANRENPERPSSENRTCRRASVSVFLCPSDGGSDVRNSYRFNRGRFGVSRRAAFDGPFSIGVLPSSATITDGLSRTAFVSERLGGTFVPNTSDRRRNVKVLASLPGVISSDDQYIPICLAHVPDQWTWTSGRYWFYAGFANTHYNHNGAPNDRRPSCGMGVDIDLDVGLHPPRSNHPGGVNLLLGDGHVEFVKDTVDMRTWGALGTHNASD